MSLTDNLMNDFNSLFSEEERSVTVVASASTSEFHLAGQHDQSTHGNWATDSDAPDQIRGEKMTRTLLRSLTKELDEQGVAPLDPIRGVINGHYDHIAVSRADGKINGALAYNKDSNGVALHQIRVFANQKKQGTGTALIKAAAEDTLTTRGKVMTAHGTVEAAVPFHQKLGAVFKREKGRESGEWSWDSHGEYSTEALKDLVAGHPKDKRIDVNDDSLFDPIYGYPKADNPYAGPDYDRELRYYEEQKRAK